MLAEELSLTDLVDDPRFATAVARAENDGVLASLLEERFATKSARHWEEALTAVGVGCVEANMQGLPSFIAFNPTLLETGVTVSIDDPQFGPMVRFAPPVSFSETPGRVGPSCVRGEHSRSVLADMGYTEAQIARYEAAGALLPPAPS